MHSKQDLLEAIIGRTVEQVADEYADFALRIAGYKPHLGGNAAARVGAR
jgi:hypothetical protein